MNTTLFLIITVGGGIVVLIVIFGIVITARSERAILEERLGNILEEDVTESGAITKGKKPSPLTDLFNRYLESSPRGEGISKELARADIKLKPAEYVAVRIISFVSVGFLFWILMDRANKIPIFTIIGALVGWNIPRIYVKTQQRKRLIKFSDQLPDMLNLMVNSLRAGYSNLQAMEAVSKEMPSPLSDEFRRVVQEIQLGLNAEQALENLLRRMPSDDMDLVVTAMKVQREVGGNLAEILDTISYTIRERVRIKGEIRVLTSQVMYSGRFLAIMPMIIIGALWLMSRDYMMQFFNPETRIPGIILLSIGALLIISGYFVMTKIATIEV
jgi:tight adherence protein B